MNESHIRQIRNILDVSRETISRLERLSALLERWSKAINLVAPSTLPNLWERHICDSAQPFALYPQGRAWLDLGSGGGFPGLVTAILLAERGVGHVDLVESNGKKTAFLRQALRETEGRGTVHAIRIESAAETISGIDAVSARALADLDGLLRYSLPWLSQGAKGFFHKGRDYVQEIEKARRSWSFDLIEHKSLVDADSVILQVDNVRHH
ncbi:MAG: 16S rRNA (guanine(527)-N(7))-methyltransferase RsmG [Pseudomonadota bacterium]